MGRMTKQTFRRRLRAAGITQGAFARFLGVNPRTVRRWALGERTIPAWVRIVLDRDPEKLARIILGEDRPPADVALLLKVAAEDAAA